MMTAEERIAALEARVAELERRLMALDAGLDNLLRRQNVRQGVASAPTIYRGLGGLTEPQ